MGGSFDSIHKHGKMQQWSYDTVLSTVAAIKSVIIDVRDSLNAGTMPQQLFIPSIRSIRSFHVHPSHCVLLIQVRILDSLNLLRIKSVQQF